MNYPLISEYVEAIKLAEDNLNQLSYLRPVINDDGLPVISNGNFATVFKMKDERNGKFYALKCFIKDQDGRNEAYKQIADELEFVSSEFIIPIKFYEKELFVNTSNGDETEFPVLLMDWVEGVTLDKYVRNHLHDQYSLQLISYQFCRVAAWLMAQPFAHGDLKPDNILVKDDGSLVLVDYDGMFVPAMKGHKAREVGSPDYRHPARTIDDFNEHLDDFSLATIAMQLYAIAQHPELLTTSSGDTLLLCEKDYRDLGKSEMMTKLFSQVGNPEFKKLLAAFLLVHTENTLSKLSFRIFNISKPTKPVRIPLSTEVTDEDIANGIKDEFGALYSSDGKRLLRVVSYVFSDVFSTSYCIKDGTQVICDKAFINNIVLSSITIPDSVTHIGKQAFSGCTGLNYITIPDSVTHIGDFAFYQCEDLIEITIPNSVIYIGNGALCSSSLNSILVSVKNNIFDSRENCNAIIHTATNVLIAGCEKTIIPKSVTHIGNYAFGWCSGLTSIAIPDSVTHIGDRAFTHCNWLDSITIPDSVTNVGAGIFDMCGKLTSIIIPNGSIQRFQKQLSGYSDKFIEQDDWEHALSTEVTEDDLRDAVTDEYGAKYSNDGKKLLSGPFLIEKVDESSEPYHIKDGTIVICDESFDHHYNHLIVIPSSVRYMGKNPFNGYAVNLRCESKHFVIEDDLLMTEDKTRIIACMSHATNIMTIPKSVKYIDKNAFFQYYSWHYDHPPYFIRFHNKISNSFRSDYAKIIVPNEEVGRDFVSKGVPEYNIINNGVYVDPYGAIYSSDKTKLLCYPKELKFEEYRVIEGCKELVDSAFNYLPDPDEDGMYVIGNKIITLYLPKSLFRIGSYALQGCTKLKKIVVPHENYKAIQHILENYSDYQIRNIADFIVPSISQ